MARTKKTIHVATVKESANRALNDETAIYWQTKNHGEAGARAYRQGVAAVLESVLHATGNYRGFRFTDGAQGDYDESLREYH